MENEETTAIIMATIKTTHSKEDIKATAAIINENQLTMVYAITAMSLVILDSTTHYVNWTTKNSK